MFPSHAPPPLDVHLLGCGAIPLYSLSRVRVIAPFVLPCVTWSRPQVVTTTPHTPATPRILMCVVDACADVDLDHCELCHHRMNTPDTLLSSPAYVPVPCPPSTGCAPAGLWGHTLIFPLSCACDRSFCVAVRDVVPPTGREYPPAHRHSTHTHVCG